MPAAIVRLDGIGLALPVAGFVVARWVDWKRVVALLAISAFPVLGMASLRAAEGAGFSVTGGMVGIWSYGRVAPFANCSIARILAENRISAHRNLWLNGQEHRGLKTLLIRPRDSSTLVALRPPASFPISRGV